MDAARLESITQHLLALPDVTCKRQFGNETYFVDGARFAAVTARELVVHLPPGELLAVLKAGIARPFVSMDAMGRHGWVQINLSRIDADVAEGLLTAAYTSVRRAHPRRQTRAATRRRDRRTAKQ